MTQKRIWKNFLLLIFSAPAVAMAAGGESSAGGLPTMRAPRDVRLQCEAKLVIYIIDGQDNHYGVYRNSLSIDVKKGDSVIGGQLAYPFMANSWTLDESISKNPDLKLFEPYLSKSGHDQLDLTFNSSDPQSDEGKATLWLDVPEPDEVFATGAANLTSGLSVGVYHKVRKPSFYSSKSLEIECKKPVQTKEGN